MSLQPITVGEKARDFDFITPYHDTQNFCAVTEGKPAVIFFLRYYGCTTCQLKIQWLIEEYPQYEALGIPLFVVLQSAPETIRAEAAAADIPFTIICDESEALYKTYAIGSRDPDAPRLPIQEAARAAAKACGLTHGKYEGNELQLPAAFVFDRNHNTVLAHYGLDSADTPDTEDLLPLLKTL